MKIIDVHGHLGKWPFPQEDVSAKQMVAELKRVGISQIIISSGLAIVYDFREGNRRLAEEISPHPELFGYVTVNANYPKESVTELDLYLKHDKFVGAKMHPIYSHQKANSRGGRYLARAVAERGVPLLVHTYSSALESPWNVLPLAEENPDLVIVMAHMGGDAWFDGIAVACAATNLYLDPVASWADADKIKLAAQEIGANRILFGTDYTLFDPQQTLGMLEDTDLTLEQKEMIAHGNAERLFRLPVEGSWDRTSI